MIEIYWMEDCMMMAESIERKSGHRTLTPERHSMLSSLPGLTTSAESVKKGGTKPHLGIDCQKAPLQGAHRRHSKR